jgi:hypothetical protein
MPLTPIFHFFWPYKASEGGSNREEGSIGGFTVYTIFLNARMLFYYSFIRKIKFQPSHRSPRFGDT